MPFKNICSCFILAHMFGFYKRNSYTGFPLSASNNTVPTGNAVRKIFLTNGPAIRSWNGSAIIKFFGILVSQIIGSIFHAPLFTQASSPPYKDMKITIGTTIQQETAITFFIVLFSGFTRKRNANPFAILDTRNQSRHIAHTYASGNPSQPSLITSIFSVPICSATLYILIHNTMVKHINTV